MTQRQNNTFKYIIAIAGTVIAIIGFVFAIGSQNQKLDTVCIVQQEVIKKVSEHDRDIVELKTDVKYIRHGIDEIKAEVKK